MEKYNYIAPQKDYITDYVVLAQAWKKTKKFIRDHNWYADSLEIDCSTIELERKLEEWQHEIQTKNYKPNKMRVVLAPKSASWNFTEEENKEEKLWRPVEELKIRPLAHLTIRDQTISTAILMCLAEAVETIQGPSSETSVMKAQSEKIFSYGNRLYCEWEESENGKKANFSWGNSRLYTKFFEDYKRFLSRPQKICQMEYSKLNEQQSLCIISIDLKSFYDCIDRDALFKELKRIHDTYLKKFKIEQNLESDDEFWEIVKKSFQWQWEIEKDSKIQEFIENIDDIGLPQGLAASGFLSNAYMIHFDKIMGENIRKNLIPDDLHDFEKEALKCEKFNKIILRDYCRYVDDIRIVVELNKSDFTTQEEIKKIVEDFIKEMLKKHLSFLEAKSIYGLKINSDKTKVIFFEQASVQNNISSNMQFLQNSISGTPDNESLQQAIVELGTLLHDSSMITNYKNRIENRLELSKVSRPDVDVKDETLKRFVAVRIVKALRMKRNMVDLKEKTMQEEGFLESPTLEKVIDHEFEITARQLIECWAYNPSLTLVLKCGLDLYPDTKLLYIILEALEVYLFEIPNDLDSSNKFFKEIKIIEYITADLFRSGATYIGYQNSYDYPESLNIKEFRQELARFAKVVIEKRRQSPWYLKQQALILLAAMGIPVSQTKREPFLEKHYLLHDFMFYGKYNQQSISDNLTIALVAQQFSDNKPLFIDWFIETMQFLETQGDRELQKRLISDTIINKPEVLNIIKNSTQLKNKEWGNLIPRVIQFDQENNFELYNNEFLPLEKIIQSKHNPFYQENALLLLINKILFENSLAEFFENKELIKYIKVKCKDWSKIQNLITDEGFLEIEIDKRINASEVLEQLYKTPMWISKEDSWKYRLGSIIRSCITGEIDFTTLKFLSREHEGYYTGLRSTSYTRKFGLTNSPQSLNSFYDPVTSWIIEVLFELLQWPGILKQTSKIVGLQSVKTPRDLNKIIFERIQYQKNIFGDLTKTPVYEIDTFSNGDSDNDMFRVVVVQTLLPKTKDFSEKDPLYWNKSIRAKHRSHIASLCKLIHLKLKTWCKAENKPDFNMVDLIVFPELSVHPDDVWLLRQLSDSIGASIFMGMTFTRHDWEESAINQALWILRSQKNTGREFIEVRQGKFHMTKMEYDMGIVGYRPYQVLVKFKKKNGKSINVSGAICYDATDLALLADLREVSDVFIVAALNKDINTFDNMIAALHYHMYQPVIIANSGQYGGSSAQAPFTKHDRLITHVHGQNQIAINIFEVDPTVFKTGKIPNPSADIKTPPAGYKGRI